MSGSSVRGLQGSKGNRLSEKQLRTDRTQDAAALIRKKPEVRSILVRLTGRFFPGAKD